MIAHNMFIFKSNLWFQIESLFYLLHVFRFTSLPNGKPLHGDDLRKELETVVEKYKGRIENMRDLGSTQSNENFNNIVSTKAPKNR